MTSISKWVSGFVMAAFIAPAVFGVAEARTFWGQYNSDLLSITQDGSITMEPGEVRTVTARFRNEGPMDWKNDGPGYVTMYTYEPKYRRSAFDPGTWLWGDKTARIQEAFVGVGEMATISFDLRAPLEAGNYTEMFRLASDNRAWMEGGILELDITVTEGAEEKMEEDKEPVVSEPVSAEVVAVSANHVKTKAERPILLQVAVKNTGDSTWSTVGIAKSAVQLATTSLNIDTTIAALNTSVKPGEVTAIPFTINAPKTNGLHTITFEIEANGKKTGEFIELPVDVTGGSGDVIYDDIKEVVPELNLIEEPTLRIGVLIVDEETDNEVVITSDQSQFSVTDTAGTLLAELDLGEEVTAYYANGLYYYDVGNGIEQSSLPLRFVPFDDHAVMKIANFDARVTRNRKNAYNEFRNIFELRYNETRQRTWLINELQMEYYLRGLAETSNSSPIEYQKAVMTAARTFAYYNLTKDDKWQKEHFTMTAYSYDQVYRGYQQEAANPVIVQSATETAGQVVTYDGEIVMTPYFSRSDGRTRDWSEVWNGSAGWAKSVKVPCEVGKTLWGHGVGMSLQGAICMARDGVPSDDILQHFYTGIKIEQKW